MFQVTMMEALVDFADKKAGELFRASRIPDKAVEKYAAYEGRHYYLYKDSDDGIFILEEGMYKEAFYSVEDALKEEVVYAECGVQNEEDFFQEFVDNSWDFDWTRSDEFDSRTKVEFFDRWYCTDIYVGFGVLSIDGERVAFFHQSGRKMDCHYKWLSKEEKAKARSFAEEFLKKDEGDTDCGVVRPGENMMSFFM